MNKHFTSVKAAYPVLITKIADKRQPYMAYIPDFDSNTAGSSLFDAINMARDAICEEGLARQDAGLPIPTPSTEIKNPDGAQKTFVDVDLDAYRRIADSHTVKKTVTIPSYLNELGIQNKINFSALFTDALREKFGV